MSRGSLCRMNSMNIITDCDPLVPSFPSFLLVPSFSFFSSFPSFPSFSSFPLTVRSPLPLCPAHPSTHSPSFHLDALLISEATTSQRRSIAQLLNQQDGNRWRCDDVDID
eukprot:m.54379 g.54379  ORF g.54379 m.54379 type:complete len:110 (-) comp12861_c0_seq1:78-407(-)